MNIQKSANRRVGGFTLIELLVVIAIIALADRNPAAVPGRGTQAGQTECLPVAHQEHRLQQPSVRGRRSPPDGASRFTRCNTSRTLPIRPSSALRMGRKERDRPRGLHQRPWDPRKQVWHVRGLRTAHAPHEQDSLPGRLPRLAAARNRTGATEDTKLELEIFKCPGDDGPPRGAHCKDWIDDVRTVPSYDWFGNSYSCNMFMVGHGSGEFWSNSPYLRPTSRVPTPRPHPLL